MLGGMQCALVRLGAQTILGRLTKWSSAASEASPLQRRVRPHRAVLGEGISAQAALRNKNLSVLFSENT